LAEVSGVLARRKISEGGKALTEKGTIGPASMEFEWLQQNLRLSLSVQSQAFGCRWAWTWFAARTVSVESDRERPAYADVTKFR